MLYAIAMGQIKELGKRSPRGSAVADKSGRRAASRRTCCKQLMWTLCVINLRPN